MLEKHDVFHSDDEGSIEPKVFEDLCLAVPTCSEELVNLDSGEMTVRLSINIYRRTKN